MINLKSQILYFESQINLLNRYSKRVPGDVRIARLLLRKKFKRKNNSVTVETEL